MNERGAVFTCLGDETPDTTMIRAIRDALLLCAEKNGGKLFIAADDAIGLVGEITVNVQTRHVVVEVRR